MKEYISEYLVKYEFPENVHQTILDAYEKIGKEELFVSLIDNFYNDKEICIEEPECSFCKMCEEKGVHFFTGKLVFYICLSKNIKKEYNKLGLGEIAFTSLAYDVYAKMNECIENDEVVGISTTWFGHVYRLMTFNLGRLAYNVGEYKGEEEFTVGGRTVKKGDMHLNIHIPSNGRPFDKASRLASYELAYHFFKERFGGKEPLFRCESWLINPKNKEILNPKSNIISFIDDFKIVGQYDYPDDRNLWRIFGKHHKLPPEKLTRETSMQKAIADYLEKGNCLGGGIGFFVYDPVKKATLK